MTKHKDGYQPTEKRDTKPPSITTVVHKPRARSANDAGSLKEYMDWFDPDDAHTANLVERLEAHVGGRWSCLSPEDSKLLTFHGIDECWEINLLWDGKGWLYNELVGSIDETEQHRNRVLHIAKIWQIEIAGNIYERETIDLLVMMLDGRTPWDWTLLDGDKEHARIVNHDDYGNIDGSLFHKDDCWVYVEEKDGELQWLDPDGFEDRREDIYKVVSDWICGVYYTVEGVEDTNWRLALDDFDHDHNSLLVANLRGFFGGNWYCKTAGPNVIIETRRNTHGAWKHTMLFDGERWQYKENQEEFDLDPDRAEWREKVAIDLAVSGSCRVAKSQQERQELVREHRNKHLALLVDMLNMKIGGDWKIQNQWDDLQIHTFKDEYRRKLIEKPDGSFRYTDACTGKSSYNNAEQALEVVESWRERCELPRRVRMIDRAVELDEALGRDWRIVGDSETGGYAFRDVNADAHNRRIICQKPDDGEWIYIEPTGHGDSYWSRKEEAHKVISAWGEEVQPTLLEGHNPECDGLCECDHAKGIEILRAYKHRPECSVGDVVGVCKICGETQCIRDVLLDGVEFEEHVSTFEAIHVSGNEPATHEGYSTKTYLQDKRLRDLVEKFPVARYIGKRLVVVPKTFWDRVAPSSRTLKVLGLSYERSDGVRLNARCEETHKKFNSGWSHIGDEPLIDEWYPEKGHTVFYNAPDANYHIDTPIRTVEENTDLLRYCVEHDVIFYKKAGIGPYECSECNDN